MISPVTFSRYPALFSTAEPTTFLTKISLLIVGSSFPYLEFYPEPGKARGVQIDIDPTRIGLRYPVEAALVGAWNGFAEVMGLARV